jgi:hypothetical protein
MNTFLTIIILTVCLLISKWGEDSTDDQEK